MRLRPKHWPALVGACGVAFTLYLQGAIPDAVFPNSDAGLKALQTYQFAAGELRLDLRLPAETWAQALWNEGLYPFAEPYVFRKDDGWYLLYSFFFPLLSAPGFALLGNRGLYVIPLLAVWLLWFSFLRGCRGFRLGGRLSAGCLAVLIFATPLTLYSALFWEHTLAVALAFQGLVLVLGRPAGDRPASATALLAGGLIACAAAIREEHLLLVAAMLGLAAWPGPPAGWPRALAERRAAFAAGLLGTTLSVFAVNFAAYGHPLGLHTVGARATLSLTRWDAALSALEAQGLGLLRYCPAVLIPLAAVPLLGPTRLRRDPRLPLFWALASAFCVVVPLLARTEGGRQWGPRFLFVALPMFCLAAGAVLKRIRPPLARGVAVAAFTAAGLAGAWINSWPGHRLGGVATLRRNYERRLVPLAWMRQRPERFVGVSHMFVSAQLASLASEKTFFLTPRGRDMRRLAEELKRRGHQRFLYLCYPQYPCAPLDDQPSSRLLHSPDGRPQLELRRLAELERYVAYEALILGD